VRACGSFLCFGDVVDLHECVCDGPIFLVYLFWIKARITHIKCGTADLNVSAATK
jgi:hypothetical protein